MNRDAETVPAHHETPDVAELRRLLDEATPRPWHAWDRGIGFEVHTEAEHNPIRCDPLNSGFRETFCGPDARLIAAAVNALPTLLDRLAHMTEARDNARAEVERLTAKVERVRALADEWTYNGEFGWDNGSHAYGTDCVVQALDYAAAKLRRALDEEPQP